MATLDQILPRSISYNVIQIGDTVRCRNREVDRTGVVAHKDSTWAKTAAGGYIGSSEAENEWTLLDRPVKRGPQYSALIGDRFVDPSGAICVRTDQEDPDGDFPPFLIVTGDDRGYYVKDTGKIDALVPYGTDDAEHNRLCANVIEAGRQWLIGPRAHLEKPLGMALEALRNYERRDQS